MQSGGGVASASAAAATQQHRELLERYELVRVRGRGSFAQVWEARHRRTGLSVAREIAVMRLLNHPHIVRFHEVIAGGDGGHVYIVMELATQGQLYDYEDFTKRYGGGKAATAAANSLNREFGSKLKEHMQYCVDHPEEISKLAKVKAQVSEVKGVMMENIEKVLDRGEKIELLVDKTENLRSQAQDFRQQGTKVRRKMWLQNMKIKLIVLGIIIALILIIILSVCHGFKCK
uniref:V-SNARE coiled-coil homology domain-containing protein n=1 Tax=Oryza meridionalis TaxID=40149 RepID=A0A0E0E8E0_9ORYZ